MKKSEIKKKTLSITEKVLRIAVGEYIAKGPWCIGFLHQPIRPKSGNSKEAEKN